MSNEIFNFQVDSPYEEEIKFLTVISESESGREQRYQKWLKPKRTFRMQLRARSLLGQAESNQIWRFYMRHKGAFDSFYFENPTENPVTAETVGSGDGIKTVFYLGNKVSLNTGDAILVPNSLTLKRSIGGTGDYLSFAAYTINNDFGKITTNSALPSGDVLRADPYEFFYRVRFKEDNLTRETMVASLSTFGLELEEVL